MLWRLGGPAIALLARAPAWPSLLGFLAVVVLLLVGLALRWAIVIGGEERTPPFGTLVLYRLAAQSVSSLVPSAKLGGEPVRAYLLARDGGDTPRAIASVAVDRLMEMAANTTFAVVFVVVLMHHGVPALRSTLAGALVGVGALLAGVTATIWRLYHGRGVVTSIVRSIRLDRLTSVERRLGVMAASENAATRLLEQPRRMAVAFTTGVVINLGVLLEYHLLLAAFGLPADALAVVAAIFATGAAHSMPVPGGVGVLEGGEMLLFAGLGYGAETGLAVGLAVRLRELLWVLPGLVYLAWRGVAGLLLRQSTA